MNKELRTRSIAYIEIAKMNKFKAIIDSFEQEESNPNLKMEDIDSIRTTALKGLETARANTRAILITEELI